MIGGTSGANPVTDPRPCPNNIMHAREQIARRLDGIIKECDALLKTDIQPLAKVEIYKIVRHAIEAQRHLREMGEPILPPEL